MEKLNLTVAEGYPSKSSEPAGLFRDQFVKTPRPFKWYDMHVDKKECDRATVCSWSPEPAKLNSTFSRVARRNLPTAPPSRALNQDILRRWERAAREQSILCNQAAGLSRCLSLSYLEYLHAGVKQDTLAALSTAPIHIHSLFPDQLLMKAGRGSGQK